MNKDTIGLITYHSAYNYGSVLQAIATQKFLIDHFIDYNHETINYRLKKQKEYYSLIRFRFGKMALLRDLMQMPIFRKRCRRSKRFEAFINTHFLLSEEYSEPEDLYDNWNKYKLVVSGSDQIWNKHSCELHTNNWKYIYPYVLHNYRGKKVSYASSIGGMTDEEIKRIIEDISMFNSISFREKKSAKRISRLLNRNIECVLDPTFLMTKKEWIDYFSLKKRDDKPYLLYYSLNRSYISSFKNLFQVLKFAHNNNLRVKIITPYAYLYDALFKGAENCCDAGPVEFIDYLFNASLIITDSYHGTALSINFNKQFFSIVINNEDTRIPELLTKFSLNGRLLESAAKLNTIGAFAMDYKKVNEKLNREREKSISYLINAIEDNL